MKSTIINIGAVIAALIIGLTINNACAEKSELDGASKSVPADQDTVEENPYFKEIDGLLFGPDGFPCGKQVKGVPFLTMFNEMIAVYNFDEDPVYEGTYVYDDKGRISAFKRKKITTTVTYSGKSVTITSVGTSSEGSVNISYTITYK